MISVAGISFYQFVLFVHVLTVFVAFGGVFVYPIWLKLARERGGLDFPYAFAGISRIGERVIGPSSFVALLAGIYLTVDGNWDLGENQWIAISILILVALVLLGPLYFSPTEKKLSALAERDMGDGQAGTVVFSPEYDRLEAQFRTVFRLAAGSVVLAIFLMTTKPF